MRNSSSDLDINRGVRRILVKYWIDLGRLSVRSTRGIVYIYGRLQRLSGSKGPLSGQVVESLFYEVNRVAGVIRVNPHFENWDKTDGFWKPTEGGAAQVSRRADLPESISDA